MSTKSTSKRVRYGNSLLRERDVRAMTAARCHKDADRPSRDMARLTGLSRRRHDQHKSDGTGSPIDAFQTYLQTTADHFRVIARIRAQAKVMAVSRLDAADVAARLREILAVEKTREAEDTVLDLSRGVAWADRVQMTERDAALDLEKAALYQRAADLALTEEEVFG